MSNIINFDAFNVLNSYFIKKYFLYNIILVIKIFHCRNNINFKIININYFINYNLFIYAMMLYTLLKSNKI